MKSKNKYILKAFTLSTLSLATLSISNIFEFKNSTRKNLLFNPDSYSYNWRFGNIHYTEQGEGSPLLLLHDLSSINCNYEWHKLIKKLSKKYTVYTLDFLGCGQSDKPNLTYTNFLYVQMLTDFIKSVIGQRTNIIASGKACTITITSCNYDSSLFNKIILLNPEDIKECSKAPNKYQKSVKKLLSLPIIGTLIYNLQHSKKDIEKNFNRELSHPKNYLSEKELLLRKECAHLGSFSSKEFYSSLQANYLNIPIQNSIKNIDNSITLIGGADESHINQILEDYQELNPAIETTIIKDCKHYPALENPKDLLELFSIYL